METIDIEINRIMAEIAECREDERYAQERVLQVVGLAGTSIAALFAFASLSDITKEIVSMISIMTDLVFIAGFSYIATIGFENVFRFHYLKDLEGKLRLIYEENGINGLDDFYNWVEMISPVTTRNIKHVRKGYSLINFLTFTLAVVCAMGFGITITYSLYKLSGGEPAAELGFCILMVVGTIMLIVFIVGSSISKSIYDCCKDKKERINMG